MRFLSHLLCLLVFCSGTAIAQSPNWAWARSGGGLYDDDTKKIVTDSTGNIIVAGNFLIDATFGTNTISSTGSAIFAVKYSRAGNVIWAKNIGNSGSGSLYDMAIDKGGNIFLCGYISNSTVFDTIPLHAYQNGTIFLTKLDSNGNILWAKTAGGKGLSAAQRVAIDYNGNSYITGNTRDTVSFPPLVLNIDLKPHAFVAKYNANGDIQWTKGFSASTFCYSNSLAVDSAGEAVIAGEYIDTVFFDSYTLIQPQLLHNVFFAKLDTAGNVLWAKSSEGATGTRPFGSTSDRYGNTYIVGHYIGKILFGTLSIQTNDTIGGNFFIVKYNSSGQAVWAHSAGGIAPSSSNNNVGYAVCLDDKQNVFATGIFSNKVDMGGDILNSVGSEDIFVVKYDSAGNQQWVKTAGGPGDDQVRGIATDKVGNTYVGGYYRTSPIVFGTDTLAPISNDDVFLAKLSYQTTVPFIFPNNDRFVIYPNPSSGLVNLKIEQSAEYRHGEVTDMFGKKVFEFSIVKSNRTYTADLSSLPDGVYYIRLLGESGSLVRQAVLIR